MWERDWGAEPEMTPRNDGENEVSSAGSEKTRSYKRDKYI